MANRLFLLRGIPASGKSTWINASGLDEHCVVSSDEIRIAIHGIVTDENGRQQISQENPKLVWDTIKARIEMLMKNGEPNIVLDATNIKQRDMRNYTQYLDEYGYDGYVVDFTDVPEDECIRRNANRDEYRQVPELVIHRMYETLRQQPQVPNEYTLVTRDEALDMLHH